MDQKPSSTDEGGVVLCVFCGDKNPANGTVCSGCGKPLTPESTIPFVSAFDSEGAPQISWPVL